MSELSLPLRTPRLTLRALTIEDADVHAQLFSDPRVVRFLYEEPLDRLASDEHLKRRLPVRLPGDGEWLNLAVEVDGRYVGEMGIGLTSATHRQCELGFVLLPEASGHGYATEASAAMLDLAFDLLDAHRVSGRLDARNLASARVLERLGMRLEAHLVESEFVKGEWTDEIVYAITEDEWRAQRQSRNSHG